MNTVNPELRRNLWLEFSWHRVIAVPVVITLLVLLIAASDDKNTFDSLTTAAAYGYAAIVLLWGTKLAGASVIDEARERTWDAQRMSSITPWRMTWGKLLGAPSFAWYCGAILLVIFMVCGSQGKLPVARYAALMACGALMLHAMALNGGVLAARNGVANRSSGILIILVLLFLMMVMRVLIPDNLEKPVTWWGLSLSYINLLLYSVVAFGAWSVLGAYRAMCNELEIRTTPWALPSFIVFTAAYCAGFAIGGHANDPSAFFGIMACAVVTAMVLVYGLLLAENHGASAWQRLRARMQARQWQRALQELPLWLVALAVGRARHQHYRHGQHRHGNIGWPPGTQDWAGAHCVDPVRGARRGDLSVLRVGAPAAPCDRGHAVLSAAALWIGTGPAQRQWRPCARGIGIAASGLRVRIHHPDHGGTGGDRHRAGLCTLAQDSRAGRGFS